jgi:hypothetical protein
MYHQDNGNGEPVRVTLADPNLQVVAMLLASMKAVYDRPETGGQGKGCI